jgi:YHS domain-containing protein
MKKIVFVFLFLAQFTFGQTSHTNTENGLAIQGYDPVAYFKQGKSVKGKKENTFVYKGVTYRFATEASKKLFEATPEIYEPQFGGWCAYAMGALGEKVEIDPETFKIIDGKLYLFYNAYFNNTLTSWNKDEKNLLPKANTNWNKLVLKK